MPVTSMDSIPGDGVHPLIILKNGAMMAGILVREIIDITRYYGDTPPAQSPNLISSVILNDTATDIVNAAWYTDRGVKIPHVLHTSHSTVAAE